MAHQQSKKANNQSVKRGGKQSQIKQKCTASPTEIRKRKI
jgi:hypothetical protein